MLAQMKQTDIGYLLTYIIEDDDFNPVDLTGASATFIMGKKNKLVINSPAIITDPVNGVVEYEFVSQDALVSGNFLGEFRITFQDGDEIIYPRNGYITVNIQQNIDTNLPNIMLDAVAERQGEFSEKLDSILMQAGNLTMTSMNEYAWEAEEGQLTYVIPSDDYDPSTKWFQVYVDNIPVDPKLINRNTDGQFTLSIDPSIIEQGMGVIARWTQPIGAYSQEYHYAQNEAEWEATEGQLVYTMPEGVTYDPDAKSLEVSVGGVVIAASDVQKDNDSQFTLLLDSTDVPSGVKVLARWVEPYAPVVSGHKKVHEKGGYDEIDISKLKNYEELVASPLADITQINLKEYATIEVPTSNTYILDVVTLESKLNTGSVQKIIAPPSCRFKINNTLKINVPNIDFEIPESTTIEATFYDKNVIELNAEGIKLYGEGTILSPNVHVPRENGYFWDYAVIYVKADKVSIKNIEIENVPRVGVGIHGYSNIKVSGVTINGNLTADTAYTGHFGIAYDPGATYPNGNISIQDCHISRMKEGIYCGNWAGGFGRGINIVGNTFQECYDHAVYVGHQISNVNIIANLILDCVSPLAITGENHNIQGNNIYSNGTELTMVYSSAISARDVKGCVITGNNIKYNPSTSTSVVVLTQLSGSIVKDNIVSNNYIETGSNSVIPIRITNGATSGKVLENNIIDGNIIKSKVLTGYGAISVTCDTNGFGFRNKVKNNVIVLTDAESLSNAIFSSYQKYLEIEGNTIDFSFNAASAMTVRAMRLDQTFLSNIKSNYAYCLAGYGSFVTAVGINEGASSDKNIIENNDIQFTSANLASSIPLSFLSKTNRRNRISENDMCGTATVASGATYTTVTNTNVLTTSRVLVTPSNSEAGSKGFYVELFNGYFNIRTKDGVATTANATYFWEVV